MSEILYIVGYDLQEQDNFTRVQYNSYTTVDTLFSTVGNTRLQQLIPCGFNIFCLTVVCHCHKKGRIEFSKSVRFDPFTLKLY
jgi:hypothetical protein